VPDFFHICIVFWGSVAQIRAQTTPLLRFIDHTQLDKHIHTHTTGSTPLDEWSARHTSRYLHKTNQNNRRTSMPWAGLEPAIAAIKRLHKMCDETNSVPLSGSWIAGITGSNSTVGKDFRLFCLLCVV